MNVVWELVPYDANVPVMEGFNVLRVYSEGFELSGDCGMDFVVSKGFEGFVYPRVYYFI